MTGRMLKQRALEHVDTIRNATTDKSKFKPIAYMARQYLQRHRSNPKDMKAYGIEKATIGNRGGDIAKEPLQKRVIVRVSLKISFQFRTKTRGNIAGIPEIKPRWADYKGRLKSKLVRLHRHAQGTESEQQPAAHVQEEVARDVEEAQLNPAEHVRLRKLSHASQRIQNATEAQIVHLSQLASTVQHTDQEITKSEQQPAAHVQEEVARDVEEAQLNPAEHILVSPVTLVIDESTDISTVKQLCLAVRYFSCSMDKSVSTFLERIPGSDTKLLDINLNDPSNHLPLCVLKFGVLTIGVGEVQLSNDVKTNLKTRCRDFLLEAAKASSDDADNFLERLRQFEDSALRIIYEYFKEDFIYIVESSNRLLLSELKLCTTLELEYAQPMLEDPDSRFAERLLQQVLEAGREAVIGFWKCLYALKAKRPHPNLLTVLDEIIHTGDALKDKILLDEYGHNLTPELKDIQLIHKKYLQEKTQNLVEHRPPRSTQEQQSFYISERYVNIIVASIDHFRQRSKHELIETGRMHEDIMRKEWLMLEHIALNKLFRWSRQKQCVPGTVMVSGVPGVGKTTLIQKFVYDWVLGKLYQRFAFVFVFKFRELNRLDKISLEEMILQHYPYLKDYLGSILQDPEKLLFIFDGLDESNHQMNFTSSQLCHNPKQFETLGVLVVSLLRQSLLKGSSVLMTSRPTKLESLDIKVFQRVSEIIGFFPKERQMYFEQFFQNKELSEKAFDYVRENDTLYTFCYIPSYCWIICTVLSKCLKAQSTYHDQIVSSLPKTVTQLFVTFVSNILSNHSQDKGDARNVMKSIGRMAEHGVMNQILQFDERDLRSFNLDTSPHLLSSFMMESDQSPNLSLTFLHLTIQEFLAALVHYLDYSSERLQGSLNKLYTDRRYEIFLFFLCGLLDSSARSLLKCLGEFSNEALKEVTKWLKESLDNVLKDINVDVGKSLNIFYYLFESQNRVLIEEVLGSNRSFTFHRDHLTPVECTTLAFVLKSCKDTEKLDLHKCIIQRECWERLEPVLHTIKHLK
ncbi:NACHT, LRR and PYD domains-containing protein 3-like [Mixophyes fleayi]|uniref:NACHT, LRR and PYD domains-containing protein 3-like n=1 Tax=Mixophyes fleayi TaxID=3061075 RepID=UPI003F4D894B